MSSPVAALRVVRTAPFTNVRPFHFHWVRRLPEGQQWPSFFCHTCSSHDRLFLEIWAVPTADQSDPPQNFSKV